MSGDRITIDTNILIYAVNADAGEKHHLAVKVLERALHFDCALTLQSLSEFFAAVTRKNLLASEVAMEHIKDLLEIFPIVTAKPHSLISAIEAVAAHKISFWNAMLWATAQDAGITVLLSEDFQHQQLIKKVRIVNPFVINDFWNVIS